MKSQKPQELNADLKRDLKEIGSLSLRIIEKAKHNQLGKHGGSNTFNEAVEINKLAELLYKSLR